MLDVLFLHQMAVGPQFLNNGRAAFFAAHPRVFGGPALIFKVTHVAVVVDHLNEGELVRMAEIPVIGVVARRHLERACAELAIHVAI